jgi:hypothetical protein
MIPDGDYRIEKGSDTHKVQMEVGHNRICHWSIINGHLSLGRCKPLACKVLIEALRIRASSRFSVRRLVTSASGAMRVLWIMSSQMPVSLPLLQFDPKKMTTDK